jgi:hypothetical protein
MKFKRVLPSGVTELVDYIGGGITSRPCCIGGKDYDYYKVDKDIAYGVAAPIDTYYCNSITPKQKKQRMEITAVAFIGGAIYFTRNSKYSKVALYGGLISLFGIFYITPRFTEKGELSRDMKDDCKTKKIIDQGGQEVETFVVTPLIIN